MFIVFRVYRVYRVYRVCRVYRGFTGFTGFGVYLQEDGILLGLRVSLESYWACFEIVMNVFLKEGY